MFKTPFLPFHTKVFTHDVLENIRQTPNINTAIDIFFSEFRDPTLTLYSPTLTPTNKLEIELFHSLCLDSPYMADVLLQKIKTHDAPLHQDIIEELELSLSIRQTFFSKNHYRCLAEQKSSNLENFSYHLNLFNFIEKKQDLSQALSIDKQAPLYPLPFIREKRIPLIDTLSEISYELAVILLNPWEENTNSIKEVLKHQPTLFLFSNLWQFTACFQDPFLYPRLKD